MSVIKELYVENFKRIKLVSIATEAFGNVITLQGKNGQGKSSIIDSLLAAFGGPKFTPLEPVRQGQKDAVVKATLDDGTQITRHFLPEGKQRLTLVNPDGSAKKSPQAWLNQLMASVAFEPHKFILSTPVERVRILHQLLGLTESGELAQRRQLIETRKLLKRNKKEFTKQCVAEPLQDLSVETVSLQAVHDQLIQFKPALDQLIRKDGDALDRWDSMHAALGQYEQIRAQRSGETDLLRAEVEQLRRSLAEKGTKLHTLSEQQAKSPAVPPQLQQDILTGREEAKVCLKQASQRAERSFAEKQMVKTEHEIDETNEAIIALDNSIEANIEVALGSKEYAIEDDVMVSNVPFSQISQSEQLLTAVKIALIQNPELRVVRLTEGSLLDTETQQKLLALAVEHNFQVWLEKVSDSTAAQADTLIIEDGAIRAQ